MRLDPRFVWRGHLKGLTRHPAPDRPDLVARVVLYGGPLVVFITSAALGAKLRQPTGLMAGSALLAGTLLAAFGQLATMRSRLTDRPGVRQVALDALDETVAHVLMAVYAAIVTAAVLGVATAFSAGAVTGWGASAALATGSWLLALVLLIVPRLYQAYTYAFAVRDEMSGYVGNTPASRQD